MPSRNNLYGAKVVVKYSGTTTNYTRANSLGTIKTVPSLNNGGKFTPGTYRCNPFRIWQIVSSGGVCNTEPVKIGSYTDCSITGDGLAGILYTAGFRLDPQMGFVEPWSEERSQYAINKALAKASNPELEVGVMLGELRETVEGLVNPLSALRTFFKKRRTGLVDLGNMVSGSWLEWRYGIRPLIGSLQDIYNHVNALNQRVDGKLLRTKGRVSRLNNTSVVSSSNTYWAFVLTGEFRKTATVRYTAHAYFKMDRPLTWQEQYGLTLLDLPGIAWELVPLSFVYDWLVGFGAWLNALKFMMSPRTLTGIAVSQKSVVDVVGNITSVKTTGGIPLDYTSSPVSASCQSLERKCITPASLVVTPTWSATALDIQRILDAVTLSWQKLPIRR